MNYNLDLKKYKATFEQLEKDNRTFFAYSDFQALKKAEKISAENGYGKVLHINEINPRTNRLLRAVRTAL